MDEKNISSVARISSFGGASDFKEMSDGLTPESIKELMEIKGEARGVHFKNDADFVLKEAGRDGLIKVEEELKRLGYPIKYSEINQFDFYPIGLRAISLLAIKKVLNWPDERVKDLCSYAMHVSWIIKLFMKYFFSLDKVCREAPKFWEKYFTLGELNVEELNEEKQFVIIKIKDFNLHPVYCRCFEGVLSGMVKMVVKSKRITCEEIGCSFSGGKEMAEHKFLVKWE